MKIYTIFALVLIALISILGLNYWSSYYPLFSEFYDINYHLANATGLLRSGGLPLINFWDELNTPYLYLPFPFLHIFEALLLSAGVSIFFISYWLSWLFLPLSLFTAWLFIHKVYGSKPGLYSIALLSLPTVWMTNQWGRPAQALVCVLTPLVFLALAKKRYITTAILTVCCIATHFTGIVLLPFLLVYAFSRQDQRKQVFAILGCLVFSGLFYFWLVRNKLVNFYPEFLSNSSIKDTIINIFTMLVNPRAVFHGFLGILALLGIVVCYKKKGAYLILPSFFFVSLLLVFYADPMRFWTGPGIFIFSCLGGVAFASLHNFIEARQNLIKGLLVSLLILIFSYTLFYVLLRQQSDDVRMPSLLYLVHKESRPSKLTFPLADRFKIIELVKKYTDADEVFRIDSSMNINWFVSVYSLRSTLWANLGDFPKGIKLAIAKVLPSNDYSFIASVNEEYNAYVLNDASKARKISIPRPLLTLKYLYILLMLMFAIVLFDIFSKRHFT